MKIKSKIKNFFTIPEEVFEEEPSPQFERVKVFPLNKATIFLGILVFMILINTLVSLDIKFLYLRQILGFLFLIFVPGLLIMLCFKIRGTGFWEYLVYTVGLSISFIMFAGLAVNWTLPALGITDKPLSLWPILICFNIFLIALWITALFRNQDFKPKPFLLPKLDALNNIFFIIPMIFPLLSILGAFLLNNHGPNFLTMIMLGGIAVYVLMLTIYRKKLDKNIWPWAILMMSISILLASSLRSWYVSGVDTNTELSILNSIIRIKFWSPEIFTGAYGSMLSLTIFPCITNSFTSIEPNFIMKFAEIFIYALVPIVIYLLFKNENIVLAFFSSFLFISTPMFVDWWPIPLRQQIAFLFYCLMILILFREDINSNLRKILFLIFGFSMIVSHYSTTYIALAILIFSYFLILISEKYRDYNNKKEKTTLFRKENLLTLGIILLILLFGFLWYSQMTNTSEGINHFIKNSFSNFGNLFNEDLQAPGSSFIEQFTINSKKSMPEILNDYINDFEKKSSIDSSMRNNFNLNVKIPSGNNLSILSKIPIVSSMRSLFEIITKILFILGFIYFLFSIKSLKFKKEKKIFILSSYILVVFIAILPLISINYDLSRTFAQILSLSAFFSLVGLYSLLFFTKKNKIILISIFFIVYFLIFSGFYTQLIGGSEVSLNLNNAGSNYHKFYVHNEEFVGANWMFSNNKISNLISDSHAIGKMKTSKYYSNPIVNGILNLNLDTKKIVYARYTNIFISVGTQFYNNIVLYYEYPTDFLNKNKNKIYNNGGSEIFK